MTENMENKNKNLEVVELKRELGLIASTNFILGTMVGTGIFVTPGIVFGYVESVGMTLVVWLACGIISLLGALAYAELGTVVPRCGSEYAYFMEAYGPLHKFWGPLVAFLYSFSIVSIMRPVETAIVILVSGQYITKLINAFICLKDEEYFNTVARLITLVEICLITFINATSVRLYLKVQGVFTVMKMLLCLTIIGCGIYEWSTGNINNIKNGFENSNFSPKNIALAFYSGLWSYGGWSYVTNITEEIRKPEVNILRSILCSIPLITVFYMTMNLSYMTVLSKDDITSSSAVAMDFASKILGAYAPIILLGIAISALDCGMATQFGVTRLCYVAGQEGHLPKILSFIHITRFTPRLGVMLQGAISIIVILIGDDLVNLIEFVSFMVWISYGLAMVSILILRNTRRDVPRPFRVPIVIPIFVILVSIFLVAVPFVLDPSYKYLVAVVVMLVGFVAYYIVVYKNKQLKYMGKFNRFMQIFLEVVPSESTGPKSVVIEQEVLRKSL